MPRLERLALLLVTSPAFAWDATVIGPVCILSHDMGTAKVAVTHDPRQAQPYAIALEREDAPWQPGELFAMRFEGPGRLTIQTDRHQLSEGGNVLTVTDSGFGNVLNGIAFNDVAIAVLGDQALLVPLDGAAPEVAKFQACAQGAGV